MQKLCSVWGQPVPSLVRSTPFRERSSHPLQTWLLAGLHGFSCHLSSLVTSPRISLLANYWQLCWTFF